jgi:hypothetical protein
MLLEVDVDLPNHSIPDLNWVRTLAENCSELHFFGSSFHTNQPPTKQLVLPVCAPVHTGLTTFCLSICNRRLDEEHVLPYTALPHIYPPMVMDWVGFVQALAGMPSLNKLIVALHAGFGFSNDVEPRAGNGEVSTPKPTFKLQYLEISTWEPILSTWQYDWITTSSHSTLRTAIVHLEAIEALVDCRTSLTRLRILDHNRWETHRFTTPDSTLKSMSTFLSACPNLVELTAHVEVVEAFMRSPNTLVSLSLERLMIGSWITIPVAFGLPIIRGYTKNW